jgi:oxaloacetate decarboxylase alpha subunit
MALDQGNERFDTVPDEIRLYARGGYGEIPGEIDSNLYDKITRGAEPITERPGALVAPALDRLRQNRGPFSSDDDLLLAAFYDDTQYTALKDAGPIDTDYVLMETPLLTLVREIVDRPSVKSFHFIQNK